ncbi:unnamed protein product (macronuclear) [Paramecium tetraurelia]|uniref:Exonuclease domain-containing protein n=1 Tax=Paramecium tetraurelia TaxID=5888 RepID=A0E851_PARTE|nr:uncharacterized protein GSPATT00024196001 [Paramecium tetraurelia]CAK91468.1 unnamed protein product [Paramecium tetraurelia]|eukprot:XP_001458865.1 hypothetical protein (macronuclear) [Paramecium tetraurelia strain d4-2]
MFNKVQPKQGAQETQKVQSITEAMQNYDVRFAVPGSQNQTGSILAIDCEMVECENEIGASVQMLARITVVNYNGYVVLDQYYKPRFKVINYITRISGITPQIIKDKPVYNDFEKLKLQLLFKDKTIIGHTLKSDFDAMEFNLEDYQTRDLMKVDFLKLDEGSRFKKDVFEHSSEVDARAALFIFRKFRNEINLYYKLLGWEKDKQEKQNSKSAQKNQKKQLKVPLKQQRNQKTQNSKQQNEKFKEGLDTRTVQIQKKAISKKKSQ